MFGFRDCGCDDILGPSEEVPVFEVFERLRGTVDEVIVLSFGEDFKLGDNLIGPRPVGGIYLTSGKQGLDGVCAGDLVGIARVNKLDAPPLVTLQAFHFLRNRQPGRLGLN